MKILLDTCIVIDFLQKREPFAQAAYDIFYAIATNKLSCFITAKSATDIYYLMHRFTHNEQLARNNLSSLLTVVAGLDTKADDIFEAIVSPTSDFEDAVMIATARNNAINCIVTRNTKDYSKSPLPIYTPDELLQKLK